MHPCPLPFGYATVSGRSALTEPGELTQWLCTTNIVVMVIISTTNCCSAKLVRLHSAELKSVVVFTVARTDRIISLFVRIPSTNHCVTISVQQPHNDPMNWSCRDHRSLCCVDIAAR